MLGERSDQRGLWEADRLYLDHVGRDTFHGLLASRRGHLFRDSDFAEFCCADNGRDSVPLSLPATAFLFRSRDNSKGATAQMGNKSHLLCSRPGRGTASGQGLGYSRCLGLCLALGPPDQETGAAQESSAGRLNRLFQGA